MADPFSSQNRNLSIRRWVQVTPSASDFLEGDSSNFNVAVVLYTSDGGWITYYDPETATEKEINLPAGGFLPGAFTRVTTSSASGTKATEIWAGFAIETPEITP